MRSRSSALSRKPLAWRRGEDLEAFIEAVRNASLAPREMAIFSAHQMGSCRMGTDPATSVAGPWGELHDAGGVWIGDASAFPTASGTNPMLTIMALARRTAAGDRRFALRPSGTRPMRGGGMKLR